jgi:hypothetical protein
MENSVETKVEARKEWVAPELKKIGVEELTATSFSVGNDGNGTGSGS